MRFLPEADVRIPHGHAVGEAVRVVVIALHAVHAGLHDPGGELHRHCLLVDGAARRAQVAEGLAAFDLHPDGFEDLQSAEVNLFHLIARENPDRFQMHGCSPPPAKGYRARSRTCATVSRFLPEWNSGSWNLQAGTMLTGFPVLPSIFWKGPKSVFGFMYVEK